VVLDEQTVDDVSRLGCALPRDRLVAGSLKPRYLPSDAPQLYRGGAQLAEREGRPLEWTYRSTFPTTARTPRPYLFVHLTWSVVHRSPRIEVLIDAELEQVLETKARGLRCRLLAFGATDDHVHVLVSYPPTLSIADLAQGLKGFSSRALNYGRPDRWLRWQTGYFAESVNRRVLETSADYVRSQRKRHESTVRW